MKQGMRGKRLYLHDLCALGQGEEQDESEQSNSAAADHNVLGVEEADRKHQDEQHHEVVALEVEKVRYDAVVPLAEVFERWKL